MTAKRLLLACSLAALAKPAAAQIQSPSYKFLSAIEKEDGKTVTDMLDAPGSSIVNARNVTSGEGALHILVSHPGSDFFKYVLQQKGVDPNIRDAKGNTPMILAVQKGREDLVRLLLAYKANPNAGDSSGRTPMILAVGTGNLAIARVLLTNGGDPDQTDNLVGMSARAYAKRDSRNPALVQLLAQAPKKTQKAGVAGPRF